MQVLSFYFYVHVKGAFSVLYVCYYCTDLVKIRKSDVLNNERLKLKQTHVVELLYFSSRVYHESSINIFTV